MVTLSICAQNALAAAPWRTAVSLPLAMKQAQTYICMPWLYKNIKTSVLFSWIFDFLLQISFCFGYCGCS